MELVGPGESDGPLLRAGRSLTRLRSNDYLPAMSVDVRTRTDSHDVRIDATEFFAQTLPEALDECAERIRPWIQTHDLRPLKFDLGDRSATLTVESDRAVVYVDGGPADTAVIHLRHADLEDLVNDQVTPMGWLAGGSLNIEHARLGHILDWWLVLRAALDGTTPYLPGDIALVDSTGAPLDLRRTFTLDSPADELSEFLRSAGYLHIGGVFSESEMAAISDDMDRAVPNYSQGDGRSWWARLHDGTDALVRMQHFEEHSPAVAAILSDDRLVGLGRLTGDGHRPPTGIEALFKPIGVAQGISDIPWHKDCSLGRHSYMCCDFTVGISVTGADATSGQLKVVAGSHRALVWPAPEIQPGLDLPVVDLATQTGDLTIHLSCTLHMAQPPVDRPRRVLYTGLSLPPMDGDATAEGVARLRAIRESAPVTVSQPASSTVG